MTSLRFILAIILLVYCISCNTSDRRNQPQNSISKDTTVYFKYDSSGKFLLEKWGNTEEWDDDVNFRIFYTYKPDGMLGSEKRYFFDDENIECKIIDSTSYDELFYFYDSGRKLSKVEKFISKLDDSGKVIGRELYYIYDERKADYFYHSASMQGSTEINVNEFRRRVEQAIAQMCSQEELTPKKAIEYVRIHNTINRGSLADKWVKYREAESLFVKCVFQKALELLDAQLSIGMSYYSVKYDIYFGATDGAVNSYFQLK